MSNPADGSCVAEPANEGLACDEGDVCSTGEVCTMGECIDPNGGTLFYEEFANNDAGWGDDALLLIFGHEVRRR